MSVFVDQPFEKGSPPSQVVLVSQGTACVAVVFVRCLSPASLPPTGLSGFVPLGTLKYLLLL